MESSAPPVSTVLDAAPEQPRRPSFFDIGRLLVILVSYAFISLGFLCQLGGVGKANSQCADDGSSSECRDIFRYDWWTTFFQFFVAVGVLISLVSNTLKDVSMAVSIFMAVSITQMIITAEKFLDFRGDGSEYKAAAAGYILATLGDILLALVMGVTELPTVRFIKLDEVQSTIHGVQVWPRRRQQQQQPEMVNMEQSPAPQMAVPSGVQPPSGYQQEMQQHFDPRTQPMGGYQPTAQERFQNLSPHLQGQQYQQGAQQQMPPVVRTTVPPGQPAHVVNP